ncbi:MAG: hypothetical protein QXI54_08385 [Archaeoglobaceae archaeon]
MTWDQGLDFEKTLKKLLRDYQEEENLRRKTKLAILITQLRNGSRISEAIEAISLFKSTGERELAVKVRKKRGKEEFRKMIIPEQIKANHIVEIPSKEAVIMFAKRRYDFNTHSLRYAFISYLAKRGVSPQIIAKITRHSKLDMILNYTQEKLADEILIKLP